MIYNILFQSEHPFFKILDTPRHEKDYLFALLDFNQQK